MFVPEYIIHGTIADKNDYCPNCAKLKSENEKLKKLAQGWFELYRNRETMSFMDALDKEASLFILMHELGIR